MRSKTFPPIVKETVGMLDIFPQSTEDSPIGLGTRSQSCGRTRWSSQHEQQSPKDKYNNAVPDIFHLIDIGQHIFLCPILL